MNANVKGNNECDANVMNVVNDMINAFNSIRPESDTHYSICTGSKHAMFTLWLFGPKACSYIQTLGHDYKTSVLKAVELISNSNYQLRIEENTTVNYDYSPDKFQFGKYKGQEIAEVAKRDMQYLIWLSKNATSSKNKYVEKNIENVKAQVTFYFDTIRKRNEQTCKSQWIGEKNEALKNIKLTIKNSSMQDSFYGPYIKVNAEDENGNLFLITIAEGRVNIPKTFEKDSVMNISSARIYDNINICGKKVTKLHRVRFVK